MSKSTSIINKNTIKKDKKYKFLWIYLHAHFKTQLIIGNEIYVMPKW
jgi:hypothetical protein